MSPIGAIAGATALSPEELRVLGCLLEKQRTTPDQYPLSLNALRLACNQSTNRDPVVSYDEATVRDALHRLERRGLVRLASGAGSRAVKYRHLLADALPMDDGERAVITVLMLRGAQTPGELKQRSERMHAFAGLDAVNDALSALIGRELALRLERRPGQKEERYAQLLDDAGADRGDGGGAGRGGADDAAIALGSPLTELAELRERVERLERELAELRGARVGGEGEGVGVGENGEEMRHPSGGVAHDAPGIDDASSLDPRR